MLTIDKLNIGYGSKNVINDLKLSLNSGSINGLVGLNGSGKTTLLKSLAGILKTNSGVINFEGNSLANKHVAFLETEPYFYDSITGREYLNLFQPFRNNEFLVGEWATLFNIPLDELIDGYSTGMKKKLAIIGVFKLNRPVVLLDEPFNGLDLESSRILSSLLPKLISDNRIIIVTSHILDSLKTLCSQIHYLHSGKIQQSFNQENFNEMEKVVFHELDKDLEVRINKISGK